MFSAPRLRLLAVLAALCATLQAGTSSSSAGDAENPPPGAAPAADAPPDPVAEEKKKRIELDLRRDALPASSKTALTILDRFRDKDFRVWGSLRHELVSLGKDAIPPLLIGLEELDWETRAFAASCLADIGDLSTAGAIADAYARETKYGEARRQMILAITKLGAASSYAVLQKALDDEELGVRIAAMRGLGKVAPPSAADIMRKFANDRDLDLRFEALGNLAALGDEAAITKMAADAEALLKEERDFGPGTPYYEDNEHRYSQYMLGMALARTEDKRAERIVVSAVSGEKPFGHLDFLRMGAAIGLGQRAARTKILHPKLVSGLADKDAEVRVACSFGVGFAALPELVPKLAKALADNQMDVRYNAVSALGRIGTDDAADALRKALKDRADEVRLGAIRALGLVRSPAATKALLDAAGDDKYMLRVLATRKLASRLKEPGVLEALTRTAKDPDYGVREAAVAALGHHDAAASVLPLLAAALDDADFGVQANACLALAKVGEGVPAVAADEPVARRVVLLLVSTTQPKLMRAAQEFLDAVRSPSAVPVLIDALGSDSADVRKRVHVALQKMTEKSGLGFDPEGPKAARDAAVKRWHEWWSATKKLSARGKKIRAAITGDLVDTAKDLKWRGLDVALLFDSTGSMGGLINAAKQRMGELAEELEELLPSVRVSVYTYRDNGDNYLYYGTPLTFDTWKIQGYLQYADAGQGGDLPEAVFETVKNCADKLHWRPASNKVIVYAGDATHHREQDSAFMAFIGSWFTKSSQAALHALYTDAKRRSLDVKARKKRELADAARYPVLETYKRTAEAGRGRGVMLDDETALIRELLVLTFGDAWRADIENLLDFER